MDRVFSVGEISEQFWAASQAPVPVPGAPPCEASKMNRSASEWAFERFLQEAVESSSNEVKDRKEEEAEGTICRDGENDDVTSFRSNNVPVDAEEYQAILKTKLDLACAAVALTRASFMKHRDSAAMPDSNTQASSKAQPEGSGHDFSKSNGKDSTGRRGVTSFSAMQKKSTATSGSSKDFSDDEEAEGENETTQNMNHIDAKRVRRMLSNRESARRSRRRKQAHLSELETQVSQLRVENSSLLKRLTDISHKYSEAAVDNRVLKADVETLRAKVKMAEESVKRITGLNPHYHLMTELSTMSATSFDGSASDTSTEAAVPVQDHAKHHLYDPSNSQLSASDPRLKNGVADYPYVENLHQKPAPAAAKVSGKKMGRTASLRRVASLEHLQKRIRGSLDHSVGEQ